MAKKTAKKRNPQDATTRNVRASNGRDRKLGEKLEALATTLHLLSKRIDAVEKHLADREVKDRGISISLTGQ